MNLNEIVEIIKNTSLAYPTIQEFHEGDIYEYMNSGEHQYPCVFLTIESISGYEDTQNINATLFYVDRLLEDSSNKLDVQSVSITALKSVKEKVEEFNYLTFTSITYTPFTEKFADLCAGAFAQFTLQVNDELECDDYELGTLTIVKNGLYSVLGYNQVLVNVAGGAEYTAGENVVIEDNVISVPTIPGSALTDVNLITGIMPNVYIEGSNIMNPNNMLPSLTGSAQHLKIEGSNILSPYNITGSMPYIVINGSQVQNLSGLSGSAPYLQIDGSNIYNTSGLGSRIGSSMTNIGSPYGSMAINGQSIAVGSNMQVGSLWTVESVMLRMYGPGTIKGILIYNDQGQIKYATKDEIKAFLGI